MEFRDSQRILDLAAKRREELKLPYFGALLPKEASVLVAQLPEVRFIDVRTRPEWDYVGHIPNSLLLEWQSYPEMQHNPHFLEELQALVPNPATPAIFLCRSGVRSHAAAAAAARVGYTMAFNLLEGFEGNKDAAGHRSTVGGWRAAGLPWVQS